MRGARWWRRRRRGTRATRCGRGSNHHNNNKKISSRSALWTCCTVGKLKHDQSVICLVHTYTVQTNRHSDSLFASRLSFSSHLLMALHACQCTLVDHGAETMLFVCFCLLFAACFLHIKSRRKDKRCVQGTLLARGVSHTVKHPPASHVIICCL